MSRKRLSRVSRRLMHFKRYQAACQLALNARDNIAALILMDRACAYQALAEGEGGLASEHLESARWFAQHDRVAMRAVRDYLRRAEHGDRLTWPLQRAEDTMEGPGG